ncbi:mevalonate kinase [Candidatus Bathyarchaeota archaeon]|nr:mevalonate kinase [Candidatus Bathyarchaeota archaeon]
MIYSSPGKIILAGEHAVVHGYPSIVSAISLRARLEYMTNNEHFYTLSLEDHDIVIEEKEMRDLLMKTTKVFPIFNHIYEILPEEAKQGNGFKMRLESSIPESAGLGSSAAICACLVKAIFTHHGITIDRGQFLHYSKEAEKFFHENSSGIDTTASINGGTFMYNQGKIVDVLSEPIEMNGSLLIVNSRVPRDTGEMVARVEESLAKAPELTRDAFKGIEETVGAIWKEMKGGSINIDRLGSLFLKNHQHLRDLKVSTPILESIIKLGIQEGATGGKITGAGGGGCVLLLSPRENINNIREILVGQGCDVFKVTLDDDGFMESNGIENG